MNRTIPIIDLFSGPGGLGEGFSACLNTNGLRAFKIHLSIEKENSAHNTLRLRAFTRQFIVPPKEYYDWLAKGGVQPDWAKLYPEYWANADAEARCMELGKQETATFLAKRIGKIRREYKGRSVLIGGPPCQAYSLVGRARNSAIAGYSAEKDARNFLYDEYVRVLHCLRPAVFVMENVKGMLSAAVAGDAIFRLVVRDLEAEGYRLIALAPRSKSSNDANLPHSDFIVRAEEFGIPQARHRLFIVGIRSDLADRLTPSTMPRLSPAGAQVTVAEALDGMPRLRSGLSKHDSDVAWLEAIREAVAEVEETLIHFPKSTKRQLSILLRIAREEASNVSTNGRLGNLFSRVGNMSVDLKNWLYDPKLTVLVQNETRSHMKGDLARYLFVSAWGKAFGTSPKASDFPRELAPAHQNWHTGKFADRFRVQLAGRPASTITSHISKDGHYFIHPDPSQCRSLTVREAARLQTFPDNYVFVGNRTEQFVQIGNAVPPLLARQIAAALLPILAKC